MKLLNHTPSPVHLFRTMLSEETMLATVVAKVTYGIQPDGLKLANVQQPVLVGPTRIDQADFPSDGGYGKEGVDLLAIATAYAPRDGAVRHLHAGITVAGMDFLVAVVGDRVWTKSWRGFAPSDPAPFAQCPLSWQRAFGGHARVRESEVPYAPNPVGKGFVLDVDQAEGMALPNVEDVEEPLRDPLDQPTPASFYPALPGAFLPPDGLSKEIYNVAPPGHRLPFYLPGAEVALCNLTPEPAPPFTLPTHQVVAEVDIGRQTSEFLSDVDTVLVKPELGELVLTHRIVFRYEYLRNVGRVVRLWLRDQYEDPLVVAAEALA